MTEEKKLDRDDLVEKLFEMREITVYYTSGYEVTYRVTEYTLRTFMTAVAKGVNRYNLTCLGKVYDGDGYIGWAEKFVTINFANVMEICWPKEMAEAAHELVNENIDNILDAMCSDGDDVSKLVTPPFPW